MAIKLINPDALLKPASKPVAASKSTINLSSPAAIAKKIYSGIPTAAKPAVAAPKKAVKTTSTATKVYPKGTTAAGKLPASAGDKSMPAGYGSMTEFYKQGLEKNAAWAQPYKGLVSGDWAKMTPSQAYLAQALAEPFFTDSVTITKKALGLYGDMVEKAKSYGIKVNVVDSVKDVGVAGKDYYGANKGENEDLAWQNQSNLNAARSRWNAIQAMGVVTPGTDYYLPGGGGYKAVWNEQTQSHDLVTETPYDQTPLKNFREHGSPTAAEANKAKQNVQPPSVSTDTESIASKMSRGKQRGPRATSTMTTSPWGGPSFQRVQRKSGPRYGG